MDLELKQRDFLPFHGRETSRRMFENVWKFEFSGIQFVRVDESNEEEETKIT